MGKGDRATSNTPWRVPEAGVSSSSNTTATTTTTDDDWDGFKHITSLAVPHVSFTALRLLLCATVALYALNQSHLLPRSLSAVVSKTLFWPTIPISLSRRIGKWATRVDDTVVMGGAPLGFLDYPERLYKEYGVRGVINMCEEYKGPLRKYKELGIEHLYLPTTDHFEPSEEDLMSAVSFMKRHGAHGNSVYVHCRAGHGRSAAVVFAWLMYKDPNKDLEKLNLELRRLRNVRRNLWKQPNLQKLHSRFLQKGKVLLDLQESDTGNDDDPSSSSGDLADTDL